MEQMTIDFSEWVEFDQTNFPSESGDYLVTVKGEKLKHEIYLVYFSPQEVDYNGKPLVFISGKESKDEFLAVGWTETWDITEEVIAWKPLPKPYERKE